MSVCRADITRLILAGFLLAGSAQAQPPSRPEPFDPDTMEMAEPANIDRSASVEVNNLKAPNAESFGILDNASGGFGPMMWNGASVKVVRALLPQLPTADGSRTVRSLERRLLLSAANSPEGAVEGDRPSLLELRAERLMALGDLDGVLSLASAAPASLKGSLLDKIKLDALLLSGNLSGACSETKRQLGANISPETPLFKAMTLCHFVGGNALQGNMGLEMLRERKDGDAAFITAAEVVSGLPLLPNAKVTLDDLSPLHLAAFQAAKLAVPASAAAKANQAEARALTLSAANSIEVRLAAAEQAEAWGSLPTDALRKIYQETQFTTADLTNPLTQVDMAGPRARALLFRAATDQADPQIRAALVVKALEMAAARGQLPAAGRIFSPFIAALQPDPTMLPHAALIARTLFSDGNGERARLWLEAARSDPQQAKSVAALWPYLAVTAPDLAQSFPLSAYQAWRATLDSLPPEQIARRTSLVLGSLSGLGLKIPDMLWLDTLSLPSAGPRPGLFAMMQGAALEGRVGSTVLTALVNLGSQTLDKVDSLTLSESVSALSVVDLGQDARKLVIETLFANGI